MVTAFSQSPSGCKKIVSKSGNQADTYLSQNASLLGGIIASSEGMPMYTIQVKDAKTVFPTRSAQRVEPAFESLDSCNYHLAFKESVWPPTKTVATVVLEDTPIVI